jgi:hypothetical protein
VADWHSRVLNFILHILFISRKTYEDDVHNVCHSHQILFNTETFLKLNIAFASVVSFIIYRSSKECCFMLQSRRVSPVPEQVVLNVVLSVGMPTRSRYGYHNICAIARRGSDQMKDWVRGK